MGHCLYFYWSVTKYWLLTWNYIRAMALIFQLLRFTEVMSEAVYKELLC